METHGAMDAPAQTSRGFSNSRRSRGTHELSIRAIYQWTARGTDGGGEGGRARKRKGGREGWRAGGRG